MHQFINKPEDYDSIVHGETRFVIFEKKAEVSFLDTGYVYAPYVPMYLSPEIVQSHTLDSANIISRYSLQVNTANYIICSPEIAESLKEIL